MSREPTIVDLGDPDVVPARGIHSTVVHTDDRVRVISLAMAAGEELTDHAAASDATLVVLRGRADLDFAERHVGDAGAGTCVVMPAGLRHAVRAHEPTVLLLTLLRG